MRRLAIIAAITLGGCTGTDVVGRSANNVTVRAGQFADQQAVLNQGAAACAPRSAFLVGRGRINGWTTDEHVVFECR